jgi:hypothetical protein
MAHVQLSPQKLVRAMPIVWAVMLVSAANAELLAHWPVTASRRIIAIITATNVMLSQQGNVTIKRIALISLPVSVANA